MLQKCLVIHLTSVPKFFWLVMSSVLKHCLTVWHTHPHTHPVRIQSQSALQCTSFSLFPTTFPQYVSTRPSSLERKRCPTSRTLWKPLSRPKVVREAKEEMTGMTEMMRFQVGVHFCGGCMCECGCVHVYVCWVGVYVWVCAVHLCGGKMHVLQAWP